MKVLIVGDSVAGTLGVGLGQVMAQYGVMAVNEGSPGCSVSMDQLVKVLWFTDPPGKPCVNDDPGALFAQWRAWVDEFNPDVVIYMARSEVLEPGGGLELDQHRGARLRFVPRRPVPPGHRGARLARRPRGPADLAVLRHRRAAERPAVARGRPSRVTTDNQIIESMAVPAPAAPGRLGWCGTLGTFAVGPQDRRCSRGTGPAT